MNVTTLEEDLSTPRKSSAAICGVRFDFLDCDSVFQTICDWRRNGKQSYITFVNPYSAMLCRRDPDLRQAIRGAGLTLPDGIGIVAGAHLLSYANGGRLSGPEMMLYLCNHGRQAGLRHYFYGGEEGVAQRLAANLSARYPGLEVAGCHTPPFRTMTAEEDVRCMRAINSARPDILWVGLGAPKQEKWIQAHRDKLDAAAMIGVGAAFDFHSGNVSWCPKPVRSMGLEWLYRLLGNPRKMWPRYLDVPGFVGALARQFYIEKLVKRVQPDSWRNQIAD